MRVLQAPGKIQKHILLAAIPLLNSETFKGEWPEMPQILAGGWWKLIKFHWIELGSVLAGDKMQICLAT